MPLAMAAKTWSQGGGVIAHTRERAGLSKARERSPGRGFGDLFLTAAKPSGERSSLSVMEHSGVRILVKCRGVVCEASVSTVISSALS